MTPANHPRDILLIIAAVLFLLFLPAITHAEKPPDWHESAAIHSILEAHDDALPVGLSHVVAYHESRFKITAQSKYARGLMQINKQYQGYISWRFTDIPAASFQWANPEHSAIAGCNYLAYLIDRFGGSVYLGLVAYNWGEGNLSRIKRIEDIPASVTNYAESVLNMLDEWEETW